MKFEFHITLLLSLFAFCVDSPVTLCYLWTALTQLFKDFGVFVMRTDLWLVQAIAAIAVQLSCPMVGEWSRSTMSISKQMTSSAIPTQVSNLAEN